MPIYEYECFSCGAHFDRRQRFDEEPVGICPSCQGKARRVIHCVPVIFKGSGFYVTDHPSSTYSEPNPKKIDEKKPEGAKKTEDKQPENKKTEDKKPETVSASVK
jgi:putative FmdB family regulatory protein